MKLQLNKPQAVEQTQPTISSREIATLTGKKHFNVLRDIETQMQGVELKFEVYYIAENGKKNKEYKLPRLEAMGIVSGYDYDLRMKIIKRLDELENRQPEKAIQLPTPLETAIMLVNALQEVEVLTYKVDRLIHSKKTFTTSELAKELNFKSATTLNNELRTRQIQYKQNDTWLLYSKYADIGYTSTKQVILDDGKLVYDRRWTGKGRDFILNIFNSKQITA